jgi:hypothetical protein
MKRRAGKDREWEQWQDIYWKLAGAAAAISVTLEPHNNSGWEMEVSWVATEPGSGRISAFRYSGVDDYISRMEDLLKLGEGYSEVSCGDQLYPRVILTFRASYGVVAHWSPAGETQLLLGDGIISNDASVSVPELEGDTEYTGKFVSSRQRAWDAVKQFIGSGSVDGIGHWVRL